MRLTPVRLAVVMLGDRLSVAALQQNRVDTFVVQAENPAAALRAELEARALTPRTVALGLARAAVIVKPIELPSVDGETRDMVRFELERHLPFPADDAPFDFLPLPSESAPWPLEETKRVLIAAADPRLADSRRARPPGPRPRSAWSARRVAPLHGRHRRSSAPAGRRSPREPEPARR
jgi:hypothetical protein